LVGELVVFLVVLAVVVTVAQAMVLEQQGKVLEVEVAHFKQPCLLRVAVAVVQVVLVAMHLISSLLELVTAVLYGQVMA
jgi:hypothetical protein